MLEFALPSDINDEDPLTRSRVYTCLDQQGRREFFAAMGRLTERYNIDTNLPWPKELDNATLNAKSAAAEMLGKLAHACMVAEIDNRSDHFFEERRFRAWIKDTIETIHKDAITYIKDLIGPPLRDYTDFPNAVANGEWEKSERRIAELNTRYFAPLAAFLEAETTDILDTLYPQFGGTLYDLGYHSPHDNQGVRGAFAINLLKLVRQAVLDSTPGKQPVLAHMIQRISNVQQIDTASIADLIDRAPQDLREEMARDIAVMFHAAQDITAVTLSGRERNAFVTGIMNRHRMTQHIASETGNRHFNFKGRSGQNLSVIEHAVIAEGKAAFGKDWNFRNNMELARCRAADMLTDLQRNLDAVMVTVVTELHYTDEIKGSDIYHNDIDDTATPKLYAKAMRLAHGVYPENSPRAKIFETLPYKMIRKVFEDIAQNGVPAPRAPAPATMQPRRP